MSLSVQEQLNQWGKEKKPFVFLIDYEMTKPMCWLVNEANSDFMYKFQDISNIHNTIDDIPKKTTKNIINKYPVSFEAYKKKFDLVKSEIEYGNSFLVNLTACTKIDCELSIQEITQLATSKYICSLKNEFVSFSPETFIQIKENKILSFPMKGTINAELKNAKELILNDDKEIAEHATIVDLIRNDLSRVASQVHVKKYRYYEEIVSQDGKLGQVSSAIEGTLPENYNAFIGDIIFDLLPAGSISGAPKQKTKEIILKAEKIKRGYYTGIAGYFDGVNLDSCVLIRYLQADNIYRSGGGITAQSDAQKEYNEMIEKIYVPVF